MKIPHSDLFIQRCNELAILGGQKTSPNPMVGAVIVEQKEIIGEGWHECYGQAHAEINALKSVSESNRHRIPNSTLYVSLEPCSIHGNTPPCTDAILREGIKKVVIASRDKTKGVDQVSEYVLSQKGVQVDYYDQNTIGDYIASARNAYVSDRRPFIILKWAQSLDGFLSKEREQTSISTAFTQRFVHQKRSEVDAILVGSNTVSIDNPKLTTRYFTGNNPLRIVLGSSFYKGHGPLPTLVSDGQPTIVFSRKPLEIQSDALTNIIISEDEDLLKALCTELYNRKVMKLLVEGGYHTLQNFIDRGLWDECINITNQRCLGNGVKSPQIVDSYEIQQFNILQDTIHILKKMDLSSSRTPS